MDKVSRLHFPPPFLYPLPIPIPGLAPPSPSLPPTPGSLSPPASLFVRLVSVRSYSRLFLGTSNPPSARSLARFSSDFFRVLLAFFVRTPPRFDGDLVRAREFTGTCDYKFLQHRRVYTRTPIPNRIRGDRTNSSAKERNTKLLSTHRNEAAKEYGYNCCGIQFLNTAHSKLARYAPIAARRSTSNGKAYPKFSRKFHVVSLVSLHLFLNYILFYRSELLTPTT